MYDIHTHARAHTHTHTHTHIDFSTPTYRINANRKQVWLMRFLTVGQLVI